MTAGTMEGAGVPLAYEDVPGSAPAVVVVHGLDGPRPPVIAPGRRAVRYDRRGHGGSGAPEPYTGTTASEQAEDLVALLTALAAAPAVLVGDGFGALVALDVALRHRTLVAGLVLVDPPLLAFAPDGAEALGAARARLETAIRAGGPRAPTAATLADFAGLASWPITRRELRGIEAPTCVVTGADTAPAVRAAAAALSGLLPRGGSRGDGDAHAAAVELVR